MCVLLAPWWRLWTLMECSLGSNGLETKIKDATSTLPFEAQKLVYINSECFYAYSITFITWYP